MITAAAVDIGTNSVKLTVGRREAEGRLSVLLDTTEITRLGKGVDAAGRLAPDAVQRTLDALAGFGEKAKEFGAVRVAAVGTSALRDATNGQEFVDAASKRLGGLIEVISGNREAELIYNAARRDPEIARQTGGAAALAVMDIGGGSTEVVLGRGNTVQFRDSLQLGAVRLTERTMHADPPTEAERQAAIALADQILTAAPIPEGEVVAVGSGGTIANLAAMELMAADPSRRVTPDDLHGTCLTRDQIEARIRNLAAVPLAKRRKTPGLEPERADVIIAGAIIQACALHRFCADAVIVSARGLRYGLLYELLDAAA
jgi:exopolyphosphatase/guanosine-5'-triphosphate,3'-diphosphate pyrophosphatase